MNTLAIEPLAHPPDAVVRLPGSKSITNRALVCAALAEGASRLAGALFADDTLAMVECLRRLGAKIRLHEQDEEMTVTGSGELALEPTEIDARQSGTTGRFVLPLAALGPAPVRVDGHPQLRTRPFAPLLEALVALGVEVSEEGEPGHLPVVVRGPLGGGRVTLPGNVSSQFLSALLLAAPATPSGIEVALASPLVSASYVAMTTAVMASFGAGGVSRQGGGEADVSAGEPDAHGVAAVVSGAEAGARPVVELLSVPPGGYRPCDYRVEPDASAASYFFAAAAITGGRVVVEGLGSRSLQGDLAFVDLLERMGAEVYRDEDRVEVQGTGALHGIDADLSDCSDTAPTLAVVAAFADSPTTLRGIGFIRAKESDRLGKPAAELRRAGIEVDEHDDGLTVHPGRPKRVLLHTYDDHRLAMSFALLGLAGDGIEIENPGCVAKTFPDYFERLASLGA